MGKSYFSTWRFHLFLLNKEQLLLTIHSRSLLEIYTFDLKVTVLIDGTAADKKLPYTQIPFTKKTGHLQEMFLKNFITLKQFRPDLISTEYCLYTIFLSSFSNPITWPPVSSLGFLALVAVCPDLPLIDTPWWNLKISLLYHKKTKLSQSLPLWYQCCVVC